MSVIAFASIPRRRLEIYFHRVREILLSSTAFYYRFHRFSISAIKSVFHHENSHTPTTSFHQSFIVCVRRCGNEKKIEKNFPPFSSCEKWNIQKKENGRKMLLRLTSHHSLAADSFDGEFQQRSFFCLRKCHFHTTYPSSLWRPDLGAAVRIRLLSKRVMS